jgi:hypothetical protein
MVSVYALNMVNVIDDFYTGRYIWLFVLHFIGPRYLYMRSESITAHRLFLFLPFKFQFNSSKLTEDNTAS